jgi:regulator of protease activity HflC (stomatin/prohibitin superfamily)
VIDQTGTDALALESAVPTQLSQVRVPLDDAASAFAGPHPPMVLIPRYALRIRNDFLVAAVVVLLAGLAVGALLDNAVLITAGIGVGLVLLVLAAVRALLLRVPEGTVALLNRGGKYVGQLAPGPHPVPPWIIVTYLVTTRELPYDAPVYEATTRDNVRASVDMLVTFSVVDARKFVYSISAADYDRVLAAAAQDAVRQLVRTIAAERVTDLARQESEELRASLSEAVAPYGVEIRRVVIKHTRPQADFLRSLEARQLAAIQQSEQIERQALASRRQADQEALARQEIVARLERNGEELEYQVRQAETRRPVAETDAETQVMRLAKLDAAMQAHPQAAEWEREREKLEVARAPAGNTRAVVQMGALDHITQALLTRDVYLKADRADGPPTTPPPIETG